MWSVDIERITGWLASLDGDSREQVVAAIELLEDRGPRPGSSGRSELRVLFAFDPERSAIMLVAGDKAGDWNRWYKRNIPMADDLFDEHLDELKGE